jgi:hypothetical protein
MSDLDEIQRRLAEGAARHDLAATFPHEHFALLHERGLLALTEDSACIAAGRRALLPSD